MPPAPQLPLPSPRQQVADREASRQLRGTSQCVHSCLHGGVQVWAGEVDAGQAPGSCSRVRAAPALPSGQWTSLGFSGQHSAGMHALHATAQRTRDMHQRPAGMMALLLHAAALMIMHGQARGLLSGRAC